MEAQEDSGVEMIDLGTAIRVSGSGSEEREENLTEVIKR